MEKVSVCIASYNGEQHIARQLHSILDQLSSTDEIIISDDSSTDATPRIVADLKDNRIYFCSNTGRRGPVGNFQNALSMATGKLIFLSDQDDIWLPGKLAKITTLLSTYDLVLSDCTVVDAELNTLQSSFFATRKSSPGFIRNLHKNAYMGCCMAFRRGVLDYVLPIPTAVYMHDWWIGLLVELKGNVFFHREPLILYVRHGNNASPTGEGSLSWVNRFRNRTGLLLSVIRRVIR